MNCFTGVVLQGEADEERIPTLTGIVVITIYVGDCKYELCRHGDGRLLIEAISGPGGAKTLSLSPHSRSQLALDIK